MQAFLPKFSAVAKNIISGRPLPILFAFYSIFIIGLMAYSSGYNTHPDEYSHFTASRFYEQHWLPPRIGDTNPLILQSLSPYGYTYLNQFDIVYFLYGKFSSLFPLQNAKLQYLIMRALSVFLFVFLVALATISRKRIYLLILFLTPQVWYIFSYINGDGFGLFVSLLIALQYGNPDSFLNRNLFSRDRKKTLLGVVLGGLLLYLLFSSKVNYYSFGIFAGALVLIRVFHKENFIRNILPYVYALAVGLSLIGVRYSYDIALNGWNRTEKINQVREKYAVERFKPSNAADISKSAPGMGIREKGLPFRVIWASSLWYKLSKMSFQGLYGYMTIRSGHTFYSVMNFFYILFLGILLYASWRAYKISRDKKLLFSVGTLFACSFLTIFISMYHAWTFDFQPQGRYLFPIIPMIAMYVAGHIEEKDTANLMQPVLLLTGIAGLVSFQFIALPRLIT